MYSWEFGNEFHKRCHVLWISRKKKTWDSQLCNWWYTAGQFSTLTRVHAPTACAHGCGYAHRHTGLNSESCLSRRHRLSSSTWSVVHFHEVSAEKETVPVSRQGGSKGVALHLLMDLAGAAEKGRRARYSQSSTSWTVSSSSASDGGDHVKISVPVNSTAKLDMSSNHRCSLVLQWYKGITLNTVLLRCWETR